MRVNVPLKGRTQERTQGCWNCRHAVTDVAEVMQEWKTADRPRREAQIAEAKARATATGGVDLAALTRQKNTNRNDPCPCGSGAKYKRCHLDKDKAAADVMKRIDGIENATRIMDNIEGAIGQGLYMICKNKLSGHQYVNHRFLCDKWDAAQGASVARAGQGPDKLPEELKDIHGDGN